MKIRNLKYKCDLVRTYSSYTSYDAIAKELQISARTLSGYWEENADEVPDKNIGRFSALIQKIASIPLTEEAALNLLLDSPVVLHNALFPIEGESWRELLSEQAKLGVKKAPPPAPTVTLGFGTTDDDDLPVPDQTVAMGEGFRFDGGASWSGEGFLAAEHSGVWHLIDVKSGQRSFAFAAGKFYAPISVFAKPKYLYEKQTPGFYRYVLIALRGTLSEPVRRHINRTNPYSQLDLDVLGSMILQSKPADRVVLAATLLVTAGNE